VSSLESDDRVKVVIFDSAIDGFFLTHYDFLAKPEESAKFPVGRTGLQALPDIGSELALAADMRFASREKAIPSQWEVGR
jgi:enoyl-CoA hydratase/carnithine racemase